jgi:2-amino-4-hydroxy-6-hydroxymethyldihydropteridine pyrophosphokinase
MILLALGANIASLVGEPSVTLHHALDALHAQKVSVLKVSAFYATPAWPDPNDPPFVNAVAAVETGLSPQDLLTVLHGIETGFGRQRSYPNAPRPLDLDLLDYNGTICTGWPLLPHPRLETRAFVLVPLADVAPDWVHPVSGKSLAALLAGLPQEDCSAVVRQGG